MTEQCGAGTALKTKRDELVLEKFFDEYITPWYRERIVSHIEYDKARKEIDLLKNKKKKTVESMDVDAVNAKQLKCSSNNQGEVAGPNSRRHTALSENPEIQRTAGRNDEIRHKQDLQSLRLQNEELRQNINYLKEKLIAIRSEAQIELKQKDNLIEKLTILLENSRGQNEDLFKRATRIGKMFSEVYDMEWKNAFENISKIEDDKKFGILHGIVMNAFSFCKEKIEEQNQGIEDILTKNNERQSEGKIHKQITESLGGLRIQLSNEMAEEVAQDFVTRSLQGLLIMSGIKLGEKDTALRRYALKCTEICWLLLVCIPECSVSEDEVGVPFDQNIYKPYNRRVSDFRQSTVGVCVWPALFQGSNILVKGVAEPMEAKKKPLDLQR